jgi:hypothetical protein
MVMRMAVMLLWCAAAVPAAAQHHNEPAPKGAARAELGASAVLDAEGAIWAVYKEGRHVMLARSDDAGATWGAAKPVNAVEEPVAAEGDSRPKIAAGTRGELYVTWTQPLPKPYTGLIRFARSGDGGRTFSAPVTVHTDLREITHRFEAIAVNRDGKVFVAWIDKRDGVDASPPYRGAALYYAVSDDGGRTFRGDFRVAHHSCECCRIALVPQEDGSVLAFWRHVFEPNIRDHATARLGADGRVGPVSRATFDDWRIDACPHHGPSMAMDSEGKLHAVWFGGTPGKEGVRYGRLRDGSVEGEMIVGGPTAAHADLAVSGRGIAIAWKEFDGVRSQLKALRSDDGGRTWRGVDLAQTGGASDQPKVLVKGGEFLVLWNTREQPLRMVALK